MPSYALFGGRLESELTFDGLDQGRPSARSWRLRIRDTSPPDVVCTELGAAHVDADVHVHAFRTPDGYRLVYDDTGTFDVETTGDVLWYRQAGADHDAARLDVLGRVMAFALHAGGDLCLHASAALTPAGVVGFLAPKFHGKSTLAMAMAHTGCRVITDDILPIAFLNGTVVARPGVPQIRLWSDSARRLARDRIEGHLGGKHTIPDLAPFSESPPTFPLAALYLLCPQAEGADGPVAARSMVSPVRGALTLVGHAKVGQLLGTLEAPDMLQRATRVIAAAPLYRLEVIRGYEHISQVAAQILEWHSKNPKRIVASAS